MSYFLNNTLKWCVHHPRLIYQTHSDSGDVDHNPSSGVSSFTSSFPLVLHPLSFVFVLGCLWFPCEQPGRGGGPEVEVTTGPEGHRPCDGVPSVDVLDAPRVCWFWYGH